MAQQSSKRATAGPEDNSGSLRQEPGEKVVTERKLDGGLYYKSCAIGLSG